MAAQWDKTGITSSAARDDLQHVHTLAALESADYKSIYGPDATFAGEAIDDTAVLIKYTFYGDADVNGVVNFDDYSPHRSGVHRIAHRLDQRRLRRRRIGELRRLRADRPGVQHPASRRGRVIDPLTDH